MVNMPQPRNDWRTEEVKMTRCLEEYGKTVEVNTRKIRVAETERRRGKERNGKEMRGARKKKKQKRGKTGKKGSERMENME